MLHLSFSIPHFFFSPTEWYRATISAALPNTGEYEIRYTDGEEDTNIKRRCIRKFKSYEVGEEVEARPIEEPGFHRGRVVRLLPNQQYDVEIEGGMMLESIPSHQIRRFDIPSSSGPLGVGSPVVANFGGAGTYYPGIILEVHDDNTVDIEYDDGDVEEGLDMKFVRRA